MCQRSSEPSVFNLGLSAPAPTKYRELSVGGSHLLSSSRPIACLLTIFDDGEMPRAGPDVCFDPGAALFPNEKKLMDNFRRVLGLFAASLVATAAPALADTYHLADFSGHLNGGNANVKAPFNSVITQGGPVAA